MQQLELNLDQDIIIYDSGDKCFDRYTVIIDDAVFGMSHNPLHPQGFNQYVGSLEEITQNTEGNLGHLGRKVRAFPNEDVKRAVQLRSTL
jgi:hypothetical protein